MVRPAKKTIGVTPSACSILRAELFTVYGLVECQIGITARVKTYSNQKCRQALLRKSSPTELERYSKGFARGLIVSTALTSSGGRTTRGSRARMGKDLEICKKRKNASGVLLPSRTCIHCV